MGGIIIGIVMSVLGLVITPVGRSWVGPGVLLVFGGIALGFFCNVVALGLGVVALFQQGCTKTLAIVGVTISSLIVFPALAGVIYLGSIWLW